MSTGLSVFDATIQESNLWLKEVSSHLGDCERQEAYSAFRAVTHVLRDRLAPDAALNVAAQLPLLLRGIYFEGWTLDDKPVRLRSVEEFSDAVRALLPPRYRFDPVMTMRAVFAAVQHFNGPDQAHKIAAQLPAELRALWPAPQSGAERV